MRYFKFVVSSLFLLSLFFNDTAYADQTGDCTAGDEFCEQNSLATTNTTTTTNTNTNTNAGNENKC